MRTSKEGKVKSTSWLSEKVLAFVVVDDDGAETKCVATSFFTNEVHQGGRVRVYGQPDSEAGVLRVSSAIIDPPKQKTDEWDF